MTKFEIKKEIVNLLEELDREGILLKEGTERANRVIQLFADIGAKCVINSTIFKTIIDVDGVRIKYWNSKGRQVETIEEISEYRTLAEEITDIISTDTGVDMQETVDKVRYAAVEHLNSDVSVFVKEQTDGQRYIDIYSESTGITGQFKRIQRYKITENGKVV